MKIATFGADHFTCQLPRISREFLKRGYYVCENMAGPDSDCFDLAYSNNPPFDDLLACNARVKIANILDIPIHLIENGQFTQGQIDKLKSQLEQVDYVTAISQTTAKNVEKYLGVKVDKVIYNPIQDVYKINKEKGERPYEFLYVGRANDPNKRFDLIKQTFLLAQSKGDSLLHEKNLYVVGSENPCFGNYVGLISDNELRSFYEKSKFLLFPSRIEGLGLPMIEAYLNCCWPILCNDNECVNEFDLNGFAADPTPEALYEKILEIRNSEFLSMTQKYYIPIEESDFYKMFTAKSVVDKILSLCFEKEV